MELSKNDLKLFYKLHPSLLLYTNTQLKLFPKLDNVGDLLDIELEAKKEIRDNFYKNTHLIRKFVSENPYGFSQDELVIVGSWENYIEGTFYIFKHYKKYTAFLSTDKPEKVYGVLGLTDSLEEIIPYTPAYLDAVLLPFKNQIIYDGIIAPYPINFGGNIRHSFKEAYDIAKAKFGIIEKLPFILPSKLEIDKGLLKYYLKDEEFWEEEIFDLLHSDKELNDIYYRELAEKNAKLFKKRLKQYGIKNKWFVVLADVIIASGISKNEAESNACKIFSEDKKHILSIFRV